MRPTQYLAKFKIVNGEFTNVLDAKTFEIMKICAKIQGKRAYMRYNGPRRKSNPGRNRFLCQSMCLKKDATEARVYFY